MSIDAKDMMGAFGGEGPDSEKPAARSGPSLASRSLAKLLGVPAHQHADFHELLHAVMDEHHTPYEDKADGETEDA